MCSNEAEVTEHRGGSGQHPLRAGDGELRFASVAAPLLHVIISLCRHYNSNVVVFSQEWLAIVLLY